VTRARTRIAAAGGLVAAALLSACANGGPATPSKSATPRGTHEVVTGGAYPLADDLLPLVPLLRPSPSASQILDFAPKGLLVERTSPEGGSLVSFVGPSGRWSDYPLADAEIPQAALIIDDGVVLSTVSDIDGAFKLVMWAPGTGAVETVRESSGENADWSQIAVGGRHVYLTRYVGERSCLARLDLDTPSSWVDPGTLYCAEDGAGIWSPTVTDDGTVSFTVVPASDGCGSLFRLVPGAVTPDKVEGTGCVDRGVASKDLVLWNAAPPMAPSGQALWQDAPIFTLVDGVQIALGTGSEGAIAVCGGAAVWLTSGDSEAVDRSEYRRYVPGDAQIDVIYRSPAAADGKDAYETALPQCDSGVVGIQRRTNNTVIPDFLVGVDFGWSAAAGG
jgi:hypothetical protein